MPEHRRPYTDGKRTLVIRRAREVGIGPAAREFGVARNTIRRWMDPKFAETMREGSLAAKKKRRRPCIRGCGRLVSYDSTTGVCIECYNAERVKAHGTSGRYSAGCRCAACTAANTTAHRKWWWRNAKPCPVCSIPIASTSIGCIKHSALIRKHPEAFPDAEKSQSDTG